MKGRSMGDALNKMVLGDHDNITQLTILLVQQTERLEHVIKSQQNLITKQEFEPVKRAVYTTIGLVITGLLGAVIHLILKA